MAAPETSAPMPPPAESAPTPEAWRFEVGITGKQKSYEGSRPLETVDDVVIAGEDAGIDRMSDLKALFLCDGMGGYGGGDVAAKIITTSAAEMSEQQHKDGAWHGATHNQAQQLLAEQLRHAEKWLKRAKGPGGDLEVEQGAGGAVGFVQFFNDHEGNPCLAGLSIGDPTMVLADRTTGKVIDLNQEETVGAATARANGTYDRASASVLSNSVRGSRSGVPKPAHLNKDGIQNTFVVSLEPGHEYVVVNSSDGTEEVFKRRDHFREHTPDYSKGGNLDLELENIMLNTPTPQGVAKALEQEADRRGKDDDQLIQAAKFTAPAPGMALAPGMGEQTVPPSSPAEQKGSPEWFDKIDQEYPPVLADEIRATLREAGTEAVNGNAQEAFRIITTRIEELQATLETTVDVNQEAQLRRMSALYPAAAMLNENRDVLGISDETAAAYMSNIEAILAQHEDYFGSVAEAFAEDGTLPTDEELQRMIDDGDYYKLDLLSRYDIPYEMEVKIDAMFNALSAPVAANVPQERLYDMTQDPEIAKIAAKASLGSKVVGGFVKAKDFTKKGFNNYYFRAGMAGHRVQQLRVTRALLTFAPAAFLVGAGASYLGHKLGVWGGGGGAPSVTEHHAAPTPEVTLPGHEAAAMPHDVSPTIDLGDNHSLILPDGYAAHDTGSGYELYHGNQHVANLDVHFDADGHLSPAEQKLLTQQLHAAGIDVDLQEITQTGAEHAQQINGDDLDRRWFGNNSTEVDGNEAGLDVTHLGDGRVAIDISSMDHVSHLGGQSLDPQHTPMHALLTDSNGHTYDLPMHGNRIVFDTHSDVGKMLSDGSYHKIEIAQLDGHTANIVSTDFGHGGGELPDNPTTGGEGQVGTGSYEVHVTADNSHPLTTEATSTPPTETPLPTPPPATPEADTSSTGTNLAVGAMAGGAVAGAAGGAKLVQHRAAKAEAKQEKTDAEKRRKEAEEALPTKVQQAASRIAKGVTPGRVFDSLELAHILQEATDEAFTAGLPPVAIEQALRNHFSTDRNFPGTVRVQDDGSIEITPSGTSGNISEWAQHEQLMDGLAEGLKAYAGIAPNFDIYTPGSQGDFFTALYEALNDEAQFSSIIQQLRIEHSLQRIESGGKTRFRVRDGEADFIARRLDEELGER